MNPEEAVWRARYDNIMQDIGNGITIKIIISSMILLVLLTGVYILTASRCQASPVAFPEGNLQFRTMDKQVASANNAASRVAAEEGKSLDRYYRVIFNHVLHTTPSLGGEWADWITLKILNESYKWNIDPLLVTALFTQESGFQMSAYSKTGAVGIAQLQPETADVLGVNPFDPGENIAGGIYYFAEQLRTFTYAGEWTNDFAVAAYNAGPGAVIKYNGIPPYSETINHVYCVAAIFNQLLYEYNAG